MLRHTTPPNQWRLPHLGTPPFTTSTSDLRYILSSQEFEMTDDMTLSTVSHLQMVSNQFAAGCATLSSLLLGLLVRRVASVAMYLSRNDCQQVSRPSGKTFCSKFHTILNPA